MDTQVERKTVWILTSWLLRSQLIRIYSVFQTGQIQASHCTFILTLNAPIATKVVCFSRLLKCLRSLYGKQCRPRSDCSYTAPIWAVCSGSTLFASKLNFISNARQIFAAEDFSRRHFQMHFFLDALRVKALNRRWITYCHREAGLWKTCASNLYPN